MLLQYNSGATDLYIHIFEILISYSIWIFMPKAKGFFSNSEDRSQQKMFFTFYFCFLPFKQLYL